MAYKKPTVYNPRLSEERIAELEAKVQHQAERINKLLEQNTNLQIKCRILEADRVEVVRCYQCIHGSEDYPRDRFPDVEDNTYSCEHSTYSHETDFFCAYGERKK